MIVLPHVAYAELPVSVLAVLFRHQSNASTSPFLGDFEGTRYRFARAREYPHPFPMAELPWYLATS